MIDTVTVALAPEEEWLTVSARKFPVADPILPQLPAASEGVARYAETPMRFSGSGLIKGFSLERIGQEAGADSRQALVWRVEVVDLQVDGVG